MYLLHPVCVARTLLDPTIREDPRILHLFARREGGRPSRYERNYRDVMLNLVLKGDSGTPFVCEVQVTLSGISILKKSLAEIGEQ